MEYGKTSLDQGSDFEQLISVCSFICMILHFVMFDLNLCTINSLYKYLSFSLFFTMRAACYAFCMHFLPKLVPYCCVMYYDPWPVSRRDPLFMWPWNGRNYRPCTLHRLKSTGFSCRRSGSLLHISCFLPMNENDRLLPSSSSCETIYQSCESPSGETINEVAVDVKDQVETGSATDIRYFSWSKLLQYMGPGERLLL